MSVEIRGQNLLVDVGGVLHVLPLAGVPAWRKLLGLSSDVDAVAAMLTAQDDGAVDRDGNTAWGLAWQALEEAALNEAGVEAPDPGLTGILPQDVEDGQGQSPVDEFLNGPKWAEQVESVTAAAEPVSMADMMVVDPVESKRAQARQMLGLEFAAETRAATLSADPARVPVFGQAARQALEAEGVEPLASAAPTVARAATLTAASPTLPLPDGVGASVVAAALTEAADMVAAADVEFDRHLLAGIWERVKGDPGKRTLESEGDEIES